MRLVAGRSPGAAPRTSATYALPRGVLGPLGADLLKKRSRQNIACIVIKKVAKTKQTLEFM